MLAFESSSSRPQSYGDVPVQTLLEPDSIASGIAVDAKDVFMQDLLRDGVSNLASTLERKY
jgi:hypothetical protein